MQCAGAATRANRLDVQRYKNTSRQEHHHRRDPETLSTSNVALMTSTAVELRPCVSTFIAQLFAPDVTSQGFESGSLFGILPSFFTSLLEKNPDDSQKTYREPCQDHDESPFGLGLPVRLDRPIHNLHYGGVLGLVYLGEFVLLGEQFVKKFVVLYVAQAAEIVKARVSRCVPLTESRNRR